MAGLAHHSKVEDTGASPEFGFTASSLSNKRPKYINSAAKFLVNPQNTEIIRPISKVQHIMLQSSEPVQKELAAW